MMYRRDFLAGAATVALARPAIAQGPKARVLRFAPQSGLSVLDPVVSTAGETIDHAYAVFDTLYGVDMSNTPRPQMADGHHVSDDKRQWTITLRPGLRFHDGEPVRAIDCVASLRRWCSRDTFGRTLAAAVDEFQAVDDRTLRIILKHPFPLVLQALSYVGPVPPFIMPERLARIDSDKQVPEMVGSGPFRFISDEYVAGMRAAYARFEGYVPRQEPPSITSGGKLAYFDRVESTFMPDSATVASAIQTGEVDWWEFVDPDLYPLLAANAAIKTQAFDPRGFMGFLRFNCLLPPFDNPRIRQIVMSAVDQVDYMEATAGPEDKSWRIWRGMFPSGFPFVTEVGKTAMPARKDFPLLQRDLKAAGYAGERVIVLNPTGNSRLQAYGEVTADLLGKLGMNVDLQAMDWGTVLQRRSSRAPITKGGWSIFHTTFKGASIFNPAIQPVIRGLGDKGWFGWFASPDIEAQTTEWLAADNNADQKRLFDSIQHTAFAQAPGVPLGEFRMRTAFRSDITGVLPGPFLFLWNVRRV